MKNRQGLYLGMVAIVLLVALMLMDAFMSKADEEVQTDTRTTIHVSDGTFYTPKPTQESTPEPPEVVDDFKPIRDCPWSKKLQKKIKKICRKYSISFELIMSMAYTESRFNKTVVGDEGEAYGAWQIHPSVWKDIINKLGYKKEDMLRAVPAAEVTCYIMRAHFEKWDDVYYALMAWNGGGAYAFKKRNAGQITSYAAETEQRRYIYEQRD